LDSLQICPTFANFEFNLTDDGEEIVNLAHFVDEDIPIQATNVNVNIDVNAQQDDDDLDYGGNGYDEDVIAQEKQTLQEVINEGEEGAEEAQQQLNEILNTEKNEKLSKEIANEDADLFFDPKLLKNWAGPDHWKFPKAKKITLEDEENPKPAEKKRERKAPFFIDFKQVTKHDDKFFSPGKDKTTLSSNALSKNTEKNTLPPDVHYDIKMLTQLFNKPNYSIIRSDKKRKINDITDGNNDNHGGDDDDNDFGGGGFDGDDDAPQHQDNQQLENNAPRPNNIDENETDMPLIPQPKRVNQIQLNYVKSAKFVDVKSLENSIYRELDHSLHIEEKKVASNSNSSPIKRKEEIRTFTSVLETIPNIVTEDALPNINVPFCFLSLLHLANKHSLTIEQNDMNELFISKN